MPLLRRLTLAWIRRVLFFPDDQVLWIPFAARAGQEVLARNYVDAIYSTSSPVSSHLIAGILHDRTRVPWVAEFRDPWVDNPMADPLPWLHARLQRRLERWIVSSASRVVFTSTETAVAYERRYSGLAGRWHIVPNGYDLEELGAPRMRPERGTPFRLVYTGTLERPAEAGAFLAGVDLLVTDQPDVRSQLTIDFYGYASPQVEAIAAPYLVPDRLGAMIGFRPFASRADVLERVREADACLVLLGDERGMSQFVPGKLFDYIGLDAPVLAVVPTGEVRSMLHQMDWGVVTDPTPSGVADGLNRLLKGEHRTGTADRNRTFERSGLGLALGSILDEAIGSQGVP
jgi:glycosyltransferase involved in cell wall biosynthesis